MVALVLPWWSWAWRHHPSSSALPVHTRDISDTTDMIRVTARGQENIEISETPSASASDRSSSREPPTSEEDEQTALTPSKPRRERPRLHRWIRWMPYFGADPEDIDDGRFEGKVYESVDSYRTGYPHWAAYQNSAPSFRIYKRFGTLRNRVILHRQQELAILQDRLQELDEEDDRLNNFRTRSLTLDKSDTDSLRTALIDDIDAKLKQYDELLERESRSGKMQKPSARDYRNLVNYIYNEKPVVQEEANFLKHRDDFVQLAGQPESPLETLIDHIICRIPFAWLRRLFSTEAQIHKTSDPYITLTSPRKTFVLARLIATLLAISFISIPLAVLAAESICDKTKLIVLLSSIFAFPIAIQIAARPKNLELFVATATYCAVLTTLLATSANFNLADLRAQLSLPSYGDGTSHAE